MAVVKVVSAWLAYPGGPTRAEPSTMIVAERWAEQRVLMRAYAYALDKTAPTIELLGHELAIGPASANDEGSWGVHVPPKLAALSQALAEQLTVLGKRAGDGRAPRARRTDNPGLVVAPPPPMRRRNTQAGYGRAGTITKLKTGPELAPTALGYESGAGVQTALVRFGLNPEVSRHLGHLALCTVPVDFHLSVIERSLLNWLGAKTLGQATWVPLAEVSARLQMLATGIDGLAWMDGLRRRLEALGISLVGAVLEGGKVVGFRLLSVSELPSNSEKR